jgi:hypothetical protein
MNRQAQNDERSARLEAEGMERQAAHDERKVELAEETAEVKAAAAARNANGARNGRPRSND